MKRSTLLWSAAAVAAGTLLAAWAFAPRAVEVEIAAARVGTFETAVEEDGRTRVRDRYVVSAPLAGRLRRIALEEGDPVTAGAVVAVLEPLLTPMLDERTLREQQARVAGAQATVGRASAGIESARVGVAQARNEMRRTAQLVEQGFVSPAKADTDRLALQAALRELEAAQETERIARHELEQARAALVVAAGRGVPGGLGTSSAAGATGVGGSPTATPAAPSAANAPFLVRAPVAGRVLRVHQPSETVVALGAPLLDLGDTARIEVVAELLTSDAALARPGSEVRIERWGGPQVLAARVRRVEPAAFTKVSALGVEEQRVNVVIELMGPLPGADGDAAGGLLGDGWRVVARILTRREPRVLTVPVSAVFPWPQTGERAAAPSDRAASAPAFATAPVSAASTAPSSSPSSAPSTAPGTRMGVFVVESGHARLRPVTVGARNGSLAWVREGLAEGTPVIVYPPPAVADGARVRERGV